MKTPDYSYRIFPLGDCAVTIDFVNQFDDYLNEYVITRFTELQRNPIEGITEIVPAFSSLTFFYDLAKLKKIASGCTAFEWVKQKIEDRLEYKTSITTPEIKNIIRIPVCYDNEFAPDMQSLQASKNINKEEVITLHTNRIYKVYMLGFLPGFPYLGEVDQKIEMPRKNKPVNVAAGSVGIAGRQTGIYPLDSPGGWQIIGRTPLKLFDAEKKEPTLLKAGDNIEFYAISMHEFMEIMHYG